MTCIWRGCPFAPLTTSTAVACLPAPAAVAPSSGCPLLCPKANWNFGKPDAPLLASVDFDSVGRGKVNLASINFLIGRVQFFFAIDFLL